MAAAGQPQIQAMQCVHAPVQTGLPFFISIPFTGQPFVHFPQPMQVSDTVNALDFTQTA